jgi:hypothetical protein
VTSRTYICWILLTNSLQVNGAALELVHGCQSGISVAGRRRGLVLGDMAALQDEFAAGKQEQKDKNGVEFGAEKSTDHERFSVLLVWSCGSHDLGGGPDSRAATELIPRLDSVSPEHPITEFRLIAVLMSIAGRRALDRVLA